MPVHVAAPRVEHIVAESVRVPRPFVAERLAPAIKENCMEDDHIFHKITSPTVATQRVVDAPHGHTANANRVASQTVTRSPQAFRGQQGITRGAQVAARGAQVTTIGPQVATRGPQVASRGSQVSSRGAQVAAKGPQVAAKGPQVATRGPQSTLASAAKASKTSKSSATKPATTSSSHSATAPASRPATTLSNQIKPSRPGAK